jgi:hypothetical protein
MSTSSRWHWKYIAVCWRAVNLGARWAWCGGILGFITMILGSFNLVDAQQLIALALPATIMTTGGLVNVLVPDAWTAWRRGFEQGCRVGALAQQDGVYPGDSVKYPGDTVKPSPSAKPGIPANAPGPLKPTRPRAGGALSPPTPQSAFTPQRLGARSRLR